MIPRECKFCGVAFSVKYKSDRKKYCTKKCASNASIAKPNTECLNCKKEMHIKPSALSKLKHGAHCSILCLSKTKSRLYAGKKNPNYKGRGVDSDGYAYSYTHSECSPKYAMTDTDENKLHRAICASILGVRKLPKGLHVHHRDCDELNNAPENLSVMNPSDHKWIHKQFGSSCLWAVMNGMIDIDELSLWSRDKERAKRLLELEVANQNIDKLVSELTETKRGTGGYGSTGTK